MKRAAVLMTVWVGIQGFSAQALDDIDAGIYAVIQADGQASNAVFRARKRADAWTVEQRNFDNTWKNIACTGDCAFVNSSPDDIRRFFGDGLTGMYISCVHNKVLAFCAAAKAATTSTRAHLFVGLTASRPSAVRLKRMGDAE
jgi:hypothetical protein